MRVRWVKRCRALDEQASLFKVSTQACCCRHSRVGHCKAAMVSARRAPRFAAGPVSTPPVDTLGLAVGRCCGFGRDHVSGQRLSLPENGWVQALAVNESSTQVWTSPRNRSLHVTPLHRRSGLTRILCKLSATLSVHRLHVMPLLFRSGVTCNLCKLSATLSLHRLLVMPILRKSGLACILCKLSATLSVHRLHVTPFPRRSGVRCKWCKLSARLSLHRLKVTPLLHRSGPTCNLCKSSVALNLRRLHVCTEMHPHKAS